ncbi:hypothetical protein BU16DRAFT_154021 [Lophium mytilinum]|uniref:DUF2423 domain-containing protein n=1 Tax=Lophium mytilinum TaxID=390894 RepID=A0A6A6QDH2_9PEZI|nr:hypothetical protein BU16DRAFT_154021 [Lophium mytilinum]
MAKGLRSSSIKTNRKKLRTRVFAPVEVARTERLSAKLLELASQPRPAKAEMEIDADEAPKDADAPQDPQAEGLSPCISWSLPRSLSSDGAETPPESPMEKQKAQFDEDMFYTLLGVSSDIVGFDIRGDLRLAFDR